MPLKKEENLNSEEVSTSVPVSEAPKEVPKTAEAVSDELPKDYYKGLSKGDAYMSVQREMRDPQTQVLYKPGIPTPCALSGWFKSQVNAGVLVKYEIPKP